MKYEEYLREKYGVKIHVHGPLLRREMGGCGGYDGWEVICDGCSQLIRFLEDRGVKVYDSRRDFGKPRVAFMWIDPKSVMEHIMERVCRYCKNLEGLKPK